MPIRTVIILLLSIGVLFAGALIGSVLFLTTRIDQQTSVDTMNANAQIVLDWGESLAHATEDYAFWTESYEALQSRDMDAIYDYLGSGATETELFDWMFFLDADGTPLFGYGPESVENPLDALDTPQLESFLDALAEMPAVDYPIVTGAKQWHDGAAMIAMTRVTPEPVPEGAMGDALPIMVGVRIVSNTLFTRLQMGTGATRFGFTTEAEPEHGLALLCPLGTVTGWLYWTPRQPGTDLRQDLLPAILVFSAAMLLLSGLTSWYFYRQGQTLREATRLASTDQLTGLRNRAGLHACLTRPETQTALAKGHFALLTLDLDDFKAFNDSRGHIAGDHFLRAVADRIAIAAGKRDCAARLGGDEFVCLILDPEIETATKATAARISDALAEPVEVAGHNIEVKYSLGIAVGEPGLHWETVLERSDAAMYWAKRRKTGPEPVFYCSGMEPTLA